MAALAWAHEMLSLASASQGSPKDSDLPQPATTLIAAWCEALQEPEREVEEKETLLRALRCCRFTEAHDLILHSSLPLLLDHSPSLRLQAAGCLLQYTSSAPSDVLRPLLPPLVSTVTRTFTPLAFQLPSAPSSTLPKLASTLFRLLNALVLKFSPLPLEMTATLAILTSTWMHHGSPPCSGVASPSPSLARGRVPAAQGHLAFGSMSAFAGGSISPRKTRKRAESEVSIASSRATSVGRGVDSGSEDEEGGKTRDRRKDAAQIRLDALTCLCSMATTDAKSLHPHWSLSLADSPYLRSRPTLCTLLEHDPSRSVRDQACKALSAMLDESASYLAIAEDRPSKASFTSLSSSLGDLLSELHSSLSHLIALPLVTGQTESRLALLDLAAKLAANSPYGRMKRPLAWGLAKAVLPLLGSPNPAVMTAAASTLTVIVTRYTATSSSQPFEWTELAAAAEALVEGAKQPEVERAGWSLLAALVPAQAERDWSSAVLRLTSIFSCSSSPSQDAQTAFLVALIRLPSAIAVFPALSALLQQALSSPHPTVRLRACTAISLLPCPSNSPASDESSTFQPWPAALFLASSDPDPDVRAAAARAIGLLAKLETVSEVDEYVGEAVRVLLEQLEKGRQNEEERDGEAEVAGLSWALANCCDTLRVSDFDKIDPLEVLQDVLSLLDDMRSDERTRTSAFRILTALFKLFPPSLPFPDILERVVTTVQAGLAHSSAKVRWNAAIASSSILSSLFAPVTSPSSAPCDRLSLSLFTALSSLLLTDASFKTRIHAVGALSSVVANLPAGTSMELGKMARQAKEKLEKQMEEGEVPNKERSHAEALLKRLSAFLERCDPSVSSLTAAISDL
ncbi:hypothetical protein JCM8547_000468 [Rhodosporidiobolus lusitaniae]